jgi:multidrug transporter EmrE-like cation transporter
VALVLLCTLFGVAAQYLIKVGAVALPSASVLDMARNPSLVAGYSLYGISTALLILALRDGELSLLYPVISLTFVWVTILSITVFHETVNAFKITGIAIICTGVALLGTGQKK